jgi:hypothetical protein
MLQIVLTVGVLRLLQGSRPSNYEEDMTMGEFFWKTRFDDWQGAVEILNDLSWNLRWKEQDGRWYLWAGESLLFVGNSKDEFEAFLDGMALGLAVLPASILEQIRRIANE